MNSLIDKSIQLHQYKDPSYRWEILKIEIAEYAQFYSKKKASECKNKRLDLEKKLRTQEKRLACINLKTPQVIKVIEKINTKIDTIKKELDEENLYVTKGAMIRSKANFIEHGEKNTRYFFSLERNNAKSKTMSSVFTTEEKLVSNPQRILLEQMKYFKKLHTTDDSTFFYMDVSPEKIVEENCKTKLDQEITLEEIGIALKQTANEKTPGLDSIPADFLKIFYCKIKHLLLNVFRECFEVGRMFTSGHRGVITLIPKKGRDLRWVKNWRPIIMLSADYKLLSKVISNRVKSELEKIINPD